MFEGDAFSTRFDFVTLLHRQLLATPQGTFEYREISNQVQPLIDHLLRTGQYTIEQLLAFIKERPVLEFEPNFASLVPDLEEYLLDRMDERDLSLVVAEKETEEDEHAPVEFFEIGNIQALSAR